MFRIILFFDFLIEFYKALICETTNKNFFLDEILVEFSIVDDYMTSLFDKWKMNWNRVCKMTKIYVENRTRRQKSKIKRTKNANIMTNKKMLNKNKNFEFFWNYWCRISWLIENVCMKKTILTYLSIITNSISKFCWF